MARKDHIVVSIIFCLPMMCRRSVAFCTSTAAGLRGLFGGAVVGRPGSLAASSIRGRGIDIGGQWRGVWGARGGSGKGTAVTAAQLLSMVSEELEKGKFDDRTKGLHDLRETRRKADVVDASLLDKVGISSCFPSIDQTFALLEDCPESSHHRML